MATSRSSSAPIPFATTWSFSVAPSITPTTTWSRPNRRFARRRPRSLPSCLAAASPSPAPRAVGYLLPAFGEFVVAYADRSAAIESAHMARVDAGSGILNPSLVVDGRIVGTWRRRLARGGWSSCRPHSRRSARRKTPVVALIGGRVLCRTPGPSDAERMACCEHRSGRRDWNRQPVRPRRTDRHRSSSPESAVDVGELECSEPATWSSPDPVDGHTMLPCSRSSRS